MRQLFIIKPEIYNGVSLCTIKETDNDNLVRWKNDNRKVFFFQDIINLQMQERWFKSYLERENDFMFVVKLHSKSIGCMGFRMIENQADIYNVILGRPDLGGKGLMSKGLLLMCSYIYSYFTHDIQLKVLRSNTAIHWYEKNGFYKRTSNDSYFQMKLNNYIFQPLKFKKVALNIY